MQSIKKRPAGDDRGPLEQIGRIGPIFLRESSSLCKPFSRRRNFARGSFFIFEGQREQAPKRG
jgi:hypothetical protein